MKNFAKKIFSILLLLTLIVTFPIKNYAIRKNERKNNMTEKFYGATNDLIFKKIFGNLENELAIKGFLSAILDLPKEEYEILHIENPFLNIEDSAQDKIGILDVKLKTKSGKIIDLEIQVAYMSCMRERILYYLSKMTLGQIGSGEEYSKIQKVICILIATDHIIIKENKDQHNRYLLHDPKTHSTFTDKMEVNTLELKKMANKEENPELAEWVKLFNAKTEEEIDMVKNSADPAIKQAADVVLTVNQDEELRTKAEQRENAVRAYRSEMIANIEKGRAEGLEKGLEKGRIEIAKNGIKMGLNIKQVSQLTGLSLEEIKKLES